MWNKRKIPNKPSTHLDATFNLPSVNIVDCVASELKFAISEVKLVGKRASELIKAHNHDPRSLLDVILFVQAPNLLLLKEFIGTKPKAFCLCN